MDFLKVFIAWLVFSVGTVNLVGEACENAYQRVHDRSDKISNSERLYVWVRLIFLSGCLAFWYYLLF